MAFIFQLTFFVINKMYLSNEKERYIMMNWNKIFDYALRTALVALSVAVFGICYMAFGNVVLGLIASAFYVYEVARI